MKALSGWKQIAIHLNQGVRTVQRWEKESGLPVHRVGHRKRSPVVAFVEELDAWQKSAPTRLLDIVSELREKIAFLERELATVKRQLR